MKMKLTREIIAAAARDAGNRSMRRAGRKEWSEPDYDATCEEYARLVDFLDGATNK